MKEEPSSQQQAEEKNDPISCNHKIQSGKYKGFSNYEMLSHSSGGGRDFNLSVCRNCGEVKVFGSNLVDGKWQHFSEEFSIHYPDSVAAIVKNCNYMNADTDGYVPFVRLKGNK